MREGPASPRGDDAILPRTPRSFDVLDDAFDDSVIPGILYMRGQA